MTVTVVMRGIDAKFGSADRLLGRAIGENGVKRARLIKKARGRLDVVSRKAAAAAGAKKPKKRITPACAASLSTFVSEVEGDLG